MISTLETMTIELVIAGVRLIKHAILIISSLDIYHMFVILNEDDEHLKVKQAFAIDQQVGNSKNRPFRIQMQSTDSSRFEFYIYCYLCLMADSTVTYIEKIL